MDHIYQIRPLRPGDFSQAASIEAAVTDGWSEEAIRQYADMPVSRCFVAEGPRGVCGFAAFTCVADEANLDALSVDASMRRHGVARKLLCAAFDVLRTQAVTCVFLEVRTQNQPARALYDSLGFIQIGIRKRFYTNPSDDAILMKMKL